MLDILQINRIKMVEETISFTSHVLKKDLEAYSQALFKRVTALQLENSELLLKLEHLEMLLKNSNVPIIGEVK